MNTMTGLKNKQLVKNTAMALACGFVLTMGGQAEAADKPNLIGANSGEKYLTAEGNTTTKLDEAAVTAIKAGITTDWSRASSSDNAFIIKSGEWKGAFGGYSSTESSANNKVFLTGNVKVNNVYGGAGDGTDAENNEVSLFGGTQRINIVYGGFSSNESAINNTVNLGGYIDENRKVCSLGAVTITYDGLAKLRGGYSNKDGADSLGNKLNVFCAGNVVDDIDSSTFQEMNFYIPKTVENGNTMLEIANDTIAVNLSNITVKAGVQNGSKLKKGDEINLIKTTLNNIEGFDSEKTGILEDKNFALYGLDIKTEGKKLFATVTSVGLSEDSKILAETRAGGMAMLNTGTDFVLSKGMENAVVAADNAEAEAGFAVSTGAVAVQKGGFAPFAAVGGNNMRYNTGSHVDVKGWSVNLGFSRKIHYTDSTLMIAPLIEYGRGNYTSHLDNGVRGDGKQQFFGIGCVVKQENKSGIYYEGGVRIGRMKGDYNGSDNSYDTESNYLALHAGMGKKWQVTEKNAFDLYGKFFYTRQGSDSVQLSNGGGVYDFDTINSYRLRIGTRWTHKIAKAQELYAGLAWDYEFDSEARASYMGLSTPSPTMKGSSGMLELGWRSKATKTNPFSVDLGLTGFTGKQRGLQFNAGFNWEF